MRLKAHYDLCRPDFPAGNHRAGISGGLGGKVIGMRVDNDVFSGYFFYIEAFVVEGRPGVALISEKREQIACVAGVGLVCRVEVAVDMGEIVLAAASVVYMHGVEIGGVLYIYVGEAEYLCLYQNASVRRFIKFHEAGELRGLCASPHPGCGPGGCVLQKIDE